MLFTALLLRRLYAIAWLSHCSSFALASWEWNAAVMWRTLSYAHLCTALFLLVRSVDFLSVDLCVQRRAHAHTSVSICTCGSEQFMLWFFINAVIMIWKWLRHISKHGFTNIKVNKVLKRLSMRSIRANLDKMIVQCAQDSNACMCEVNSLCANKFLVAFPLFLLSDLLTCWFLWILHSSCSYANLLFKRFTVEVTQTCIKV